MYNSSARVCVFHTTCNIEKIASRKAGDPQILFLIFSFIYSTNMAKYKKNLAVLTYE